LSEADDLLAQARIRLREAEALAEAGLFDGAVSRAYYAAFAAARAMLATDGIRAKTHRGVIQQFGKAFVQSGAVEVRVGRALAQLHRKRELADSGTGHALTRPEAEIAVALASELISVAEQFVKP